MRLSLSSVCHDLCVFAHPLLVSLSLPLLCPHILPIISLISLTLSVFYSNVGGESGRRWSLQRAGEFPDPCDESRPGLLPHPPGSADLLRVESLPVYLPPPEVGRAKQQRGGDHLLRHHPGRPNHHCGIRDESPCHRPAARQRIQVMSFLLMMIPKCVDILTYFLYMSWTYYSHVLHR